MPAKPRGAESEHDICDRRLPGQGDERADARRVAATRVLPPLLRPAAVRPGRDRVRPMLRESAPGAAVRSMSTALQADGGEEAVVLALLGVDQRDLRITAQRGILVNRHKRSCLSMKVRSPMPCSCSCLSPTRSQRRRRELHGADSDMAQRLETAMAHTLRLGSLAELHG